MLHEEETSLQSPPRTWYSGPKGLNLRFWETLSEVTVERNDDGSAKSEIL